MLPPSARDRRRSDTPAQRPRTTAAGQWIAVYGTLRSDVAPRVRDPVLARHARLARRRLGRYEGACRIPGRLVDLGHYPGLVPSERASVRGELYELPHGERELRAALQALDAFEAVNPDDPAGSEYGRRRVALESPPGIEAWVYVLDERVRRGVPIEGDDWLAFYERKLAAER